MPFDVTRALDEASGIKHPRIWTAERDIEMWKSLEAERGTPAVRVFGESPNRRT